MFFVSVDDFFTKAKEAPRLSREQEKALACQKNEGDASARQALINGYLPFVAANIKRSPKEIQTLNTVYRCVDALEKGVDSFNFLQEGETFAHHLSRRLRQCITRCIADRY